MNNMWGSMAQFEAIYWGWPIAVYLFLAGLAAGCSMASLLVRWKSKENGAIVKIGALIAPVAISLGLVLLILDLGKPLSFYYLLISYNFNSVMTLGVLLLFIYTPCSYLYAMLVLMDDLKKWAFLKPFMPIISWINGFDAKKCEIVLFLLAIGVGIYTGFLLSANLSVALWNTPILPILFLVSGFSAGISACVFLSLKCFLSLVEKDHISYLLKLDLWAIWAELALIFLLFVGMIYQGGLAKEVAFLALSSGIWAVIFWLGVILLGLVFPIILAFSVLKNHSFRVNFIFLNSLAVLIGVASLRFFIVYAGQIFMH